MPLLVAFMFAALSAACEESRPAAYPPVPPPEPAADGQATATDAPAAQPMQVGVPPDGYADTDPSALSDFRATLEPHGTWVDDPTYGTVWVPGPQEVGTDFTPYVTAGHWVYDGDDYLWVSDYEWGWVPFHYGRWVWVPGRGWGWIPGRVYAPAWVVWRTGDDDWGYVGWAPMPPVWIWRGGVAVGIGFVPWEPYEFCPRGDIFAPVIATRVVRGERAAVIASHTRPYVVAAPVVAAHPLPQPVMHGPPPATLGIASTQVAHPTGAERGLINAQRFARPSTAQPLGARPAVPHVVQSRPIVMPHNLPHYTPTPHLAAPRAGGRRR